MRKLYIVCIASISDCKVSIWWKNQKNLLNKFNKIQKQALYKILKAFKTSFTADLEIEAYISFSIIRLNKLCENYIIKIIQLNNFHSVKQRISLWECFLMIMQEMIRTMN